jgi:hypothetical protein
MSERRQITEDEFERIVNETCAELRVYDRLSRHTAYAYWYRIWYKTAEFLGVDNPHLLPDERGNTEDVVREQLIGLINRDGVGGIDTSIAAIAIEKAMSVPLQGEEVKLLESEVRGWQQVTREYSGIPVRLFRFDMQPSLKSEVMDIGDDVLFRNVQFKVFEKKERRPPDVSDPVDEFWLILK